ncbi:MAG: AraC family transcriptional regulator [Deltaproteobacteria bacterium]|nr:AraC family transcriptional regulator [Deltaproteobacteria bacterium]
MLGATTRIPEKPTVSVLLLSPLLKAIRKGGVSVDALFARAELRPEIVGDPDSRVPFSNWVALWRLASEMSGDPALGIHAAEDLEPGVFGVIDYVARCSGTLRGSVERTCRYYPLIHNTARPSLEAQGDRYLWSYNLLGGLQYPRVLAEYALACWLAISRQGVASELNPLEVHFVHGQSINMSEYRRFFRAPVRLGMERNAMVLDSRTLDWSIINAKAGLCMILDRYAQQLLETLPADKRLSDRVRELIAAELAGGDPSEDCVARKLRMSTRTLRRRLNQEGLTHRSLLDQLRNDLAALYLKEKGLAVSEAAFLLGFANTSAFHKAFKRWTGHTPMEYRKQSPNGRSKNE